jgi:hypothetical protein
MTGLKEGNEEVDRSFDVFLVGGLHHGVNVTSGNGDGDHGYALPNGLDCSGIGATPRQYLKLIPDLAFFCQVYQELHKPGMGDRCRILHLDGYTFAEAS